MSDAHHQQADQAAQASSRAPSWFQRLNEHYNNGQTSTTSPSQHSQSQGEHGGDEGEDDDDENELFETDEGEAFEEDTADQAEPIDIDNNEEEGGDEEDEEEEVDDHEEEIVLVVDERTGLRRAASLSRSDPRHPDSHATIRSSSPLARRLRRQHVRMTTPRSTTTTQQRGRSTAVVAQGSGSSSQASASSSSAASATAGTGPSTADASDSASSDRQGTTTSAGTTTTATTLTGRSVAVPVIDEKAQSELRRKIMDIQRDPTISFAEKAAMIQRLMSSKWQESKKQDAGNDEGKDGASEATEADLKTTYYSEEHKILGCKHYRRGCKLKANCCGKWFNCRFCHDDICDHAIVRTDTKYMLCMHCKSIQPAAQDCKDCHKQLARYYCNICKLWDDDPGKRIYHCDDCGICRIGRGLGEDYFHCKKCNVCMNIERRNNHKCIERNLECDCPICGEFMFTSTSTVIFMPCGHCIHSKCHEAYTRTSYQCPTCWKALADMSEYYAKVDQLMQQQPMPPEYASYYSIVLCNDCEVKTETAFHFLYHKCGQCKGYNTKVLQTFQRVANGQDKVVENAGEGSGSGSQQNNSQRGGSIGVGNGDNIDGGGNSAGPSSVDDAGIGSSSSSTMMATGILDGSLSSSSTGLMVSSIGAMPPAIRRAGSPGSLETNNDDGGDGMSSGRGSSSTLRMP